MLSVQKKGTGPQETRRPQEPRDNYYSGVSVWKNVPAQSHTNGLGGSRWVSYIFQSSTLQLVPSFSIGLTRCEQLPEDLI